MFNGEVAQMSRRAIVGTTLIGFAIIAGRVTLVVWITIMENVIAVFLGQAFEIHRLPLDGN